MASRTPFSPLCRRLLLTLLALLSSNHAVAQRTHDITIDDYFRLAWVTEVAVSPDGTRVAYTEDRWEGEDENKNRDLWVLDVAGGGRERLTFDKAWDHSPAWSVDGAWIYYAAGVERAGEEKPPYDGDTQVWRVPSGGGEPQAVTRIEGGIDLFDLSADGKALYYTVRVKTVDDEWKELRDRWDGVEYGHGVTEFSQLWVLDLESWRASKLADERRVVFGFEVSPDRRFVAMITTADEELIHYEGGSRIEVYDASSGTVRVATPDGWRAEHFSPFGWIDNVTWSADSEALAFTISFDGYPTRIYVIEGSGAAARLRELDRPDGVFVWGGSLRWRPGGRDLAFVAEQEARSRLHAIAAVQDGGQGRSSVLTPGDVTVDAYDFSSSGDVGVVITSTLTDPPDVYLISEGGGLSRLTQANPQVDTWKVPQVSLVDWTATDGRRVQGVLELPPGYAEDDGPLPMVVYIHGGPTWSTKYRFRFDQYGRTALAARGYALLAPNYRGSIGYGDSFLFELIGRKNDVDISDILAGVNAMVSRGIADPERLGVMGWSNGGFLTNGLIAAGNRFKAASSGAGVVDQVIEWGLEDTPGHVVNFTGGGMPWERVEAYLAASPLYQLGGAMTPTLIHVGAEDERVPPAHARTLYRALNFYLKVPSELIIYPGEPHELGRYDHRKTKMEWDHAWFDRYLGAGGAD